MQPSEHAAGGRVIVSTQPLSIFSKLHDDLCDQAYSAGNQPIDLLYCLPGNRSKMYQAPTKQFIRDLLIQKKVDIWDGLDPKLRQHYPNSVSQHRIVFYDSCRGLEGWTTFLDNFDEFWSQKYNHAMLDGGPAQKLIDDKQWAQAHAWRWAMIPLTRSIDTVLIRLSDLDNPASRLILNVGRDLSDFVEIHDA